jgi:hypothetical protein
VLAATGAVAAAATPATTPATRTATPAPSDVLVALATIDPGSPDVEVRVELAIPAQWRGDLELRALPLDGTAVRALRASPIGAPGSPRAASVDDDTVELAPLGNAANQARPRALVWRLASSPDQRAAGAGATPDARRWRIEYTVERAVRVRGDRLQAVIPVVTPAGDALAPAFEARVSLPAEWSVYSAFPSELALGGDGDRHSVSLPTPTSVLRLEARRGSAPWITLERGLDAAALVVLGVVLAIGAARLRREVASR